MVVTGIGIVGPTGIGLQPFWASLVEGRSGIARITRFDPTAIGCQIAGEVHDTSYETLLDPRKLRTATHVTQLALAAAQLAKADAGKSAEGFYRPDRMGVSIGSAFGGVREADQQHTVLLERGARRVNPFISNSTQASSIGAEIATAFGAQGPRSVLSNGSLASLQAVADGASLIARGDLDLCLAGGAESPIAPTLVAGLSRTQELSNYNDDPERASCPFDRHHGGLVLSEGSCVLVLESAEKAAERGARVYCEVLGFAASCDALGLYGLDPTYEPGARAIHQALARSTIDMDDIDYVCAYANSSPAFDRKEIGIIKKVYGRSATKLPISSIKGVFGDPVGASGAFQIATVALAIAYQVLPPTHNLKDPDPECDFGLLLRAPLRASVGHALVTAYSYGGDNACLVLAAPTGTRSYSCFISYSSSDQAFAEKLCRDLRSKGISCWFAPEDMKIGDRIRPRIDESIRAHDRLLLVLSGNSIASHWVEQEVETALAREREGEGAVLFPIRLDDAVMRAQTGWVALVRNTRHIGDFRSWEDRSSYERALNRLLRDLKE